MHELDIDELTLRQLRHRAAEENITTAELLQRWMSAPPQPLPVSTSFLDAIPAEIVLCDALQDELPIVYVNPAFEAITGYTRQEVIGRNPRFLQGPESDQPPLKIIRAALQENHACHVILRNYRKDGTMFWNELHIAPIRNSAGVVTHFIGIQHDITARKRAEQALQTSETRLRSLLESQTAMIVRTDLDGVITYVNDAWNQKFGWLKSKFVGSSSFESIIPEDHVKTGETAAACVANPGQPVQVMLRKPRQDGGLVWTLWEFVALQDNNGEVAEIQCMGFDISEIRLLQERTHLQQQAMEAAANAIVITDRNAIIEWVNPAFTALTGYELEEARGKNPNILVKSGLQDDAFYEQLWNTILSGQVWFGKMINRRKDGALYHEEQIITPVYDADGAIQHFIAIKQDVTEREQAHAVALERERLAANLKKEKEYNSVIQQTIASLAHDVRIPLAAIATSRDMLSRYYERMDADKRQEKLDAIGKQLHYLTELLNELTLLVGTSFAQTPSKAARFNLELLCQITIQEMQESSGSAHRLEFVTDKRVRFVFLDEVLVSRILLNLLSNAIKYSPIGSEIRLELNGHQNTVMLRVVDHGIGLDADEMNQIFQPFYRSERVQSISGTGLGLSIVQNCVERLGGRIRVDSEPGKGTTFTVNLPFEQSPSAAG